MMLTWKTRMREKTTAAHKLQKIPMREDYNDGSTEATTSCTSILPRGGYNGGNDLSLSHSLYTVMLCTHNNATTTPNVFAPSHIYTHMTFRLFTHMAPRGLTRTHSRMCPFQPVGRISTGS